MVTDQILQKPWLPNVPNDGACRAVARVPDDAGVCRQVERGPSWSSVNRDDRECDMPPCSCSLVSSARALALNNVALHILQDSRRLLLPGIFGPWHCIWTSLFLLNIMMHSSSAYSEKKTTSR